MTSQHTSNRPPPPSSRGGGALEPGSLLNERYRIDAPIGEGGMGRVYAAEHVLLRKKVAIKLLRADRANVPEVAARFEREALASANIEHPNIAGASDFGRIEDGSVYLVLEYVPGKSLRSELKRGPLPVARSLHIARQIASALVAAEERGIVHRDLKPENVMLVEKLGDADFVKVLDFGIARVPMAESDDGALTQVGVVFGTPEYMAPEQALGQRVDSRADLFALGVILFEMIAGARPHGELKSPAVKLAEAPPRLSERAPKGTVTPALDELVQKLIEPDQRKRFQRVTEALGAIEAVASDFGPHLPEGPGFGGRFATPAALSAGLENDPLEALPTFLPGDPLPAFDLPSEPEPAAVEPRTLLRAPNVEPERSPRAQATPAPAPVEVPLLDALDGPAPLAAEPALGEAAREVRAPSRPISERLLEFHRGACQFIDQRRHQLPPFIRRRVKRVPASTLLAACAAFGAVLGVSGVLVARALSAPPAALEAAGVPALSAEGASADTVRAAASAVGSGEDAKPEGAGNPSPEAAALARAEELVTLAKARLLERDEAEALDLLGRALGAEPKLAGDESVHAALLRILRSKTAARVDAAFALLQGVMVKDCADVIYDAAFDPEVTRETRDRAAAWLRTKDFDRVSTPALYSAVKLRFAASCQQKFQLLRLAQNQGGARTLAYLQELSKKTACNAADCYPCLTNEDRLKETIAKIEQRLGS